MDFVQAKDPSVVFIVKTWANEARLKKAKRKIDFEHMFSVPRINCGVDLVLIWKDSIMLDIETYSKYHIDYHKQR